MIQINEYFDGKVKSLGFASASGKATVGVMEPGEYEFSTTQEETMTVLSGGMSVKLPEEDEDEEQKWEKMDEGDEFDVPANTKFQVKVKVQTAYLCQYL